MRPETYLPDKGKSMHAPDALTAASGARFAAYPMYATQWHGVIGPNAHRFEGTGHRPYFSIRTV